MSAVRQAAEILDQEFLPVRAKILEIAAALDRLQRGSGNTSPDPRLAQLQQALQLLAQQRAENRAEQIQLLFSRDYQPDWRQLLEVPGSST